LYDSRHYATSPAEKPPRASKRLSVIGVALGLIGTYALRRIVQSQLYEISAMDLTVLIPVPLALLVVALLASFLPDPRASRIEPAVMLRTD
jgi:putative ABC transport system permease protein